VRAGGVFRFLPRKTSDLSPRKGEGAKSRKTSLFLRLSAAVSRFRALAISWLRSEEAKTSSVPLPASPSQKILVTCLLTPN
jgi:hypothetical protein